MSENVSAVMNYSISKIKKRDGRVADFNTNKIKEAILRAADESRPSNYEMANMVAQMTVDRLEKIKKDNLFFSPIELEKTIKEILSEEGQHTTSENFKIVNLYESFDVEKITKLIYEVAKQHRHENLEMAEQITLCVAQEMEKKFNAHTVPSVEDVQDIVEKILIEQGHAKTAKSYILYRQKRTELRKAKIMLGVEDDLKLPLNAITILAARYLRRDENRNIIETPKQLFRRVAKAIAEADLLYDPSSDVAKTTEEFYQMLTNFEFLPNSPTLMNAGTNLAQLSGCFVIPVPDSIEGIFDAIKTMALVQKSGGGTGFSFSKLRPSTDIVRSTAGVASGPVSFMKIFNAATEEIKQGGKRRGANMGILRVDHPDILDFVVVKEQENMLNNFNLSIAVTDRFMDAVVKDQDYELINPRTRKPTKKLKARAIWNLIMTMAWKNGEPGIIFIDKINKANPTPHVGEIESTNPCGEQPLLPFESCNLGSINLAKMVKDGQVDWNKLRDTVKKSIHFLDNVIDVNKYPVIEIELMTKANRKIGLGVMGFADMLIELGIPYNSSTALRVAESIMKFISEEGRKLSVELAKQKGSFPNFKGSVYERNGYDAMRNATITTIAPTGTISEIAGCSNGIEPLFSIVYVKSVAESLGENLTVINPFFEQIAIRDEFYNEEMIKKISRATSIQNLEEIPERIRKIFVTAHDLTPEAHVRMQAAFQRYTDNAVSKTVNFSNNATPHDIEKVYLLSYQLGCKGITVYRDGSRKVQILNPMPAAAPQSQDFQFTKITEFTGICETCNM
jgi:ribonucleoside-diphosphate reductase alpha chain